MKQVAQLLEPLSNSYVFHDFMEEINEPVYFHELISRANSNGLQFMANADPFRDQFQKLTEKKSADLMSLSEDPLEVEQYTDFMLNSTFRQTALVHANVPIERSVPADRITKLRLASQLRPTVLEMDPRTSEHAEFVTPDGQSNLSVPHPLTKAALLYLHQKWPHTITYDELIVGARALLAPDSQENSGSDEKELADLQANLMTAFGQGNSLVELHTYSPDLTTEVSARPLGSMIARRQAEQPSQRVINLRHQFVELDEANRQLLCLLDGTRDHASLTMKLIEMAHEGTFEVSTQEGEIVEADDQLQIVMSEILTMRLERLGQVALLKA